MRYNNADSSLHAHNAILQVWTEFGAIGALMLIAFLIFIYRKIEAEENIDIKRLYFTGFMAVICCAMTGYGLWQSWQLGLFFGFAALLMALGRYHKQSA